MERGWEKREVKRREEGRKGRKGDFCLGWREEGGQGGRGKRRDRGVGESRGKDRG